MREFRRPGGSLATLPRPARLLYAGFLALTCAGFLTALALYYDGLGLGAQSAAAHYLGNADDALASEIIIEKSARDLLEVSHFHLFTMPVLLLVLAHLFLLARGGRWKGAVVGIALVSTACHVAGPWLVRYGGAGWGWVMPTTGLAFAASYAVMALWPLPELLARDTQD